MRLPAGMSRFLRFGLIGGLGFVVDAGMLILLMEAGASPFAARACSIALAVFVTWRLNRAITFGQSTDGQLREAGRYALVALSVAALNYGLYATILFFIPSCLPVLAAAISTACCMLASFTGYGRFAFRP